MILLLFLILCHKMIDLEWEVIMSATPQVPAFPRRLQSKERIKGIASDLLAPAGICIDGTQPFDLRVKDDAFYEYGLPRGLTGIREAYVDGWWDTDQLDVLTFKALSHGIKLSGADKVSLALANVSARIRNRQSRRRSLQIRSHYDLGDDLFKAMLDERMVYSCGYWKNATTLGEAQEAKLDMVCRKVALRPGMQVLDIGCGWGSFAKFAAERYGVSVTGITICEDQARLGPRICSDLPVEIRMQDYRQLSGNQKKFDAVVSIGMFEHVGYKNYRNYMEIVRECLKPEGLFLLQTIGGNTSQVTFDPWLNKHIFPNAMLPSARQITAACEGTMVIEDWHSFGLDYDRTLMAWFENFDRNWPLLSHKYGEKFYRMWKCYLLTCAGLFRAREIQLWQIVLSGPGMRGEYASIR
jgi:cyclopropane-fatty-acyl-phospholipid synthase